MPGTKRKAQDPSEAREATPSDRTAAEPAVGWVKVVMKESKFGELSSHIRAALVAFLPLLAGIVWKADEPVICAIMLLAFWSTLGFIVCHWLREARLHEMKLHAGPVREIYTEEWRDHHTTRHSSLPASMGREHAMPCIKSTSMKPRSKAEKIGAGIS
jgi:hypothetical protein